MTLRDTDEPPPVRAAPLGTPDPASDAVEPHHNTCPLLPVSWTEGQAGMALASNSTG